MEQQINFAERLAAVQQRIRDAAMRAGRATSEVKLIAVSKTHSVEAINAAIAAGVTDLGENRVQEAEPKIDFIGRTNAKWHLIGPLQGNKARRAVKAFDVIHTLDSVELAIRLDRHCAEEGRTMLPVLIQVSLAGEASKSGVEPAVVDQLVDTVRDLEHLSLQGLMTLPPFFDVADATRPYFQQLRELRDRLAAVGAFAGTGELSMGMSHDFEVAIQEGATMVRVGTAIFGERENLGG
ncbi:MAG: YggS family pyridoxal phosphate-dependent enzyme [Pyrinomonadaceae bacterium]